MPTPDHRTSIPTVVVSGSTVPTKEAFDELRRDVERLKRQLNELTHRLDELHPRHALTGL